MFKRIFVGLLIGLVVGGGVAALLTQALGIGFDGNAGALFAYLFASLTGVLVGLIAGKPIWSQAGKIEAGLKAFFGALISVGLMFAIRQWVTMSLDLSTFPFQVGTGAVSELPATTLPLIGALIGGFFEADNTPEEPDTKAQPKTKVRVGTKASAAAGDEDEGAEAESEKKTKRR
jgi:hypothetical protein